MKSYASKVLQLFEKEECQGWSIKQIDGYAYSWADESCGVNWLDYNVSGCWKCRLYKKTYMAEKVLEALKIKDSDCLIILKETPVDSDPNDGGGWK